MKYEYVIFHAMSRSLNMVIKYKAKAITFKAKALNTPRYQTNIPGINYSLLSSGSNMKHKYAYCQNGSGWCSLMHSVSAMLYNNWWALRVSYLNQMITGCDWCLGYVNKAIKYKAKAIPFKAKALNTSRCRLWVFALKTWIAVICIRLKQLSCSIEVRICNIAGLVLHSCCLIQDEAPWRLVFRKKHTCLSSKRLCLMLTDV